MMTEIPDDEVEAVAGAYYRRKTGKPWLLLSEKRKQRVLEDVRAVLAAVRPRWEKQLDELRSERDDAGLRWGEHYNAKLAAVEDERDAARAELERVREHADLMRQALQEVADMWTGRDAFMPIPAIERARAALHSVPEQEQP